MQTTPLNHYSSRTGYRPDIDGLRALAVLAVVAFHASPNMIRGGFVGVDCFFVISGFLITSIIRNNLEMGNFSFTDFYSRRIKRIFPALIVTLVFCYSLGWFTLIPSEYTRLGKHIAGGAGFISNLILSFESGYFDVTGISKPLAHLWSLGIEEQFYFFWPLLLYFVFHRLRNSFVSIIFIIIALSFALNMFMVQINSVHTFYSPLTRMWELLLGGVLAEFCFFKTESAEAKVYLAVVKRFSDALSILGMALILGAIVFFNNEVLYPGWRALLPTLGTCLVVAAGKDALLNRFILSRKEVVWFGLISYPLYLWHWPILSFLHTLTIGPPSLIMRLGAVAMSIALAWVTFQCIERPLRYSSGHGRSSYRTVLGLAVAMTLVGGVGFYTYEQHGLSSRSFVSQMNAAAGVLDWDHSLEQQESCKKNHPFSSDPHFYCVIAKTNQAPTIALLGDSHANHYYPGLSKVLQATNENLINLGMGGCSPLYASDPTAPTTSTVQNLCNPMGAILNYILSEKSIKSVWLSGYDASFILGHDFGKERLANDPDANNRVQIYTKAMTSLLGQLERAGKEIVILRDIPDLGFDVSDCVVLRPWRNNKSQVKTPCSVSKTEFEQYNLPYWTLLDSVLKSFPKVKTFNASQFLCDSSECKAIVGGTVLYRDKHHLSMDGSLYIARKFKEEIYDNK